MKMKTIKSVVACVLMALMGTSAVAADTLIEIVGTETKSFTSAKTVQANYYWRYFLQSQSGMSLYTDYVVCDSTNGPKNARSASAATKTAKFTGKKFTPGYVRVWLQQRQGTSGDYGNVESFYAYVAQTDAVSATVGGGNKTIATPTISAAAAWTCQSANPGVATATVNSGSATSRTVTITPVAAGTTTIDVCSGSTSYSTNSPLRQRITVTVAPPVADVVVSNAVFVANGRTAVLTNDVGQTIAWNVCTNSVSGDEKIAKVVQKDECVAVSCTTNTGYTTVTLMTSKTNYHFMVCSVVASIEKTVKQYSDNESFYRPSNQNCVIAPTWSETNTMPDTAWETFVAMLDPETFLTHPSGQRYVERDQRYPVATWAKDEEDPTGPTYYLDARAANRNELQVAYDDADKVAEYLDKYIQKASYSAEIKDNIVNLNGSLSVQGNRFYVWKGSTAPETQTNDTYKVIADLPDDSTHWVLQASSTSGNHTVVTNLSDLTGEQWFKYEIDIVDNGTFLDEALKHDPPYATKDPATGRYRINPNDGNAKLTLFATLNGKTTPIVEEDGTLMNRWVNDPVANLTLWITDHADAGAGKVHLQFEPTFWEKLPVPLSDWAQEANDLSRFAMAWGKTPAEVETCIGTNGLVMASLRANNASLPQSDKRVWLTVKIPPDYLTEQGDVAKRPCSKIVIRKLEATGN